MGEGERENEMDSRNGEGGLGPTSREGGRKKRPRKTYYYIIQE